jgi:hypothetical protein
MRIANRICFFSGLRWVVLGWVGAHTSHPFHVCIGQMRHNAQSGTWEVSLRMHPRDLELALSDLHKESVARESENFPKVAVDFLENQFFLIRLSETSNTKEIAEQISGLEPMRSLERKSNSSSDTDGNRKLPRERRSTLQWVGMESERGWLWIHMELVPPESAPSDGKLYLVHRIFLDRIEMQENTVAILHAPGNRGSLQFKKGESIKPLTVPVEVEPK